jgi:NADH-quinone oxidoreductase subunit M
LKYHLITLMIALPFLGALLQAFMPQFNGVPARSSARWVALLTSLAGSICVASMQTQTPQLQAFETLPWIGSYAISYEMGVDGLNALLVLLISIVFPILIAAEWNQKVGGRGMHGLFLVLQGSLLGAICAQDAFLLFFFWGLSALPYYFLIGIWGGEERETAAFQSIVTAAIGNALVFGALLLIYYAVDPHTFSIRELAGGKLDGKTFDFLGYSFSVPGLCFLFISLGLALRAPLWPIHGWFTRVARQAPFSVLVALCAAAVPVGTYIFLRLCYTLFPATIQAYANVIVIVGAVNLILGGVYALSQRTLRSLLAFICVGELGFVLVGIGSLSAAGVVGAVLEQLALGLGLAGFGLFAGWIGERAGESVFLLPDGTKRLGGLAAQAPLVAVVAGIFIASLLGFPGLGGFVGHALLIIGSYAAHPILVLVAGAAILLSTYALFTMYRSVFLGEPAEKTAVFADLNLRERLYLLPLVCGTILCGVYPKPLLELVRPTVLALLGSVK